MQLLEKDMVVTPVLSMDLCSEWAFFPEDEE